VAKTRDDILAELGAESRLAHAQTVMGYRVIPISPEGLDLVYARASIRRQGKAYDDEASIQASIVAQEATYLHFCVVDEANQPLMKYGEWVALMRDGYGARIEKLVEAAKGLSMATDEGVEDAKNVSAAGGSEEPSAPVSNSDSDTPSPDEPA
jgi:hypothetical protein